MKMPEKRQERGQALILIVFGIVAIISLVGLALDGAHAFADRRQAQNAVDAAAMAAAIARVSQQNFRDAAIYQIKNNGFLNDGVNSNLEVYQPPMDGNYSCQVRPTDCKNFIQVKLTSKINTWFAPVVGVSSITNQVSAVAQANSSIREPFYDGSAIVALSETNCRAVEFTGNSTTVITGSGIFVNSNCNNQPVTNPQKAFYSDGNGFVQAPWIKVVGGAHFSSNSLNLERPLVTGAVPVLDIKSEYDLPAPICGAGGMVDPLNPTVALPGAYDDFPPDGVKSMEPGVYCVGNLKIHDDLVGGDILFVLSGGVRMDGNAYISLKAKTEGDFAGLLMYMPPSHQQQITIDGNSGSEFSGLILAPSSHITIQGTGKPGRFSTQIIGDTVTFSGNSNMQIDYNEDTIYKPTTHARVELVH
jgi:Flp pilus assembly protein TadG